jgi:hypothetical protein
MNLLAADALVALHLAFVLFVALGGLLALRWPRVAWLHVPAAAWGVVIELTGWICPLTPFENELRRRGGAEVYTGDFVANYLLPVLYPEGLTREAQIAMGAVVLLVNAAIYWRVATRGR